MAGIVDWVSRRLRGADAEVASELVPEDLKEGRKGAIESRQGSRGDAPAEIDDGVYVTPTPITAGDSITVKYSGMLAKAGADQVYLHMGYGLGTWNAVSDTSMGKSDMGVFEAKVHIPIEETSRFHFCFRDSAGNWDNNDGLNWSYEIHAGELPMQGLS